MKKILMLCWAAVAALMMPVLSLAEGAVLPNGGAFFDWSALGTFAGAVAATVFIVQLLKLPMDKVWKIPTRLVCYVIALAVMVTAMLFTQGWSWEQFALCIFNAALVALSAMSTYEVTISKVEGRKLDDTVFSENELDLETDSTEKTQNGEN